MRREALTAVYDLEYAPVSYDVVPWLVRAMQRRDAERCAGLHVAIVPKEDGLGGFSRHWGPHDAAAALWRLWHIVLPACQLAGATVTLAMSRAHGRHLTKEHAPVWAPVGDCHLDKHVVASAKAGGAVPVLRASKAALRYVDAWLDGKRPVTLTLRNQSNDPARNADPFHWEALGKWLETERGRCVVRLRDTNDALQSGIGYAELDIDLRLALYERAEMNIVGNNGPAALLWHSSAPYMRVAAGLPKDWKANLGLEQGEQVPWAHGAQRLIYGEASFERMRDAFAAWEAEGPDWIL